MPLYSEEWILKRKPKCLWTHLKILIVISKTKSCNKSFSPVRFVYVWSKACLIQLIYHYLKLILFEGSALLTTELHVCSIKETPHHRGLHVILETTISWVHSHVHVTCCYSNWLNSSLTSFFFFFLLFVFQPLQLRLLYNELKPLLAVDFVASLPKELAERIFSYLSVKSLSCVAQCNRLWRERSNHNAFWYVYMQST